MVNKETLAMELVERARALGADAAEVFISESSSLSIEMRLGKIETIENAGTTGLGLRVLRGGSTALTSTRDLSPDSLDELLRETLTLVRVTDPDPGAGLPPAESLGAYEGDLGLSDPALASMTLDEKTETLKTAEAVGMAQDPRITNSSGAFWRDNQREVVLANSAGFVGRYQGGAAAMGVSLIAEEGGVKQIEGWHTASRRPSALESPRAVGLKAAERALRKLGARSLPTARRTVVFDQSTGADLMKILCEAASASSIARKSSFLVDRLGEEIVSPLITLVDDATLYGGMGSRPFDGEGVRSRPTQIVSEGRLNAYLADTYFGKKLGIAPTGNAGRSFSQASGVSPSNLILTPGERSPEEILKAAGEGLYVTRLYWVGINPVTGDLSRGAEGLYFKDGVFEHAVQEITIAGNILDMLKRVVMVGDDLNPRSALMSPTFAVEDVTVTGRS